VLLWYIFLAFVIGVFIYIIFSYFHKVSVLMKKLEEREQNYRELAKKYEAIEEINLNLEETTKHREKDFVSIPQSRLAELGETTGNIEQTLSQSLNSLSLIIQDVREAHKFREIDDQYIDGFTQESMLQIKQMSRSINDFRQLCKQNEEKKQA
jgi:multidrug efflux pump subunit AcrB